MYISSASGFSSPVIIEFRYKTVVTFGGVVTKSMQLGLGIRMLTFNRRPGEVLELSLRCSLDRDKYR